MKLPPYDRKFLLLLVAVITVIALEILSLTGIHVPMPYAPFLFAAFILGIGHSVVFGGVKALIKLDFSNINLLMLIAVVAAFYLGEYPEAAVVVVLYVLGERLEEIGMKRSRSALDELVAKSPKTAVLKESGAEMPIDRVPAGALIRVKPHDLIPLDGIIETGNTAVDEAAITGEAVPKDKYPGDTVFAGTLNKSGFIEVRTTKAARDTTFSKIIQRTFEAQARKSPTQKFIQRFAKIYTPSVLILSVLLLLVTVFILGLDFDERLRQSVVLLVIACPCALVISTPVAVYAAIGNASSKGVLIKGGKYIEALAAVRAVCLDKTRTLTFGNPVVSDVISLQNTDREELLACTAGAEIFSEHPLAQAIVDKACEEGYIVHETEDFRSVAGQGATAKCLVCQDETIFAGKLDFIRTHQPVTEEAERVVKQLSEQGKTSVVVSFGDGVAGIIGLTDEVKPDSVAAVKTLKKAGVVPVMLTGDHEKTARFVAGQVGIDWVHGGLLPEDKAALVEELTAAYRHVAMAGDGINDAPALARASVGIAMGAAGSDTAVETADVALMNDKLSLIPFLIRLGRAAVKTIRFNAVLAVAIKMVFILAAFFGYGHLVLAIAADVGVTLVVILISLRLLNYRRGYISDE